VGYKGKTNSTGSTRCEGEAPSGEKEERSAPGMRNYLPQLARVLRSREEGNFGGEFCENQSREKREGQPGRERSPKKEVLADDIWKMKKGVPKDGPDPKRKSLESEEGNRQSFPYLHAGCLGKKRCAERVRMWGDQHHNMRAFSQGEKRPGLRQKTKFKNT